MKWQAMLRTGTSRYDYGYRRFTFTAGGFMAAADRAKNLSVKHGGTVVELKLIAG